MKRLIHNREDRYVKLEGFALLGHQGKLSCQNVGEFHIALDLMEQLYGPYQEVVGNGGSSFIFKERRFGV